MESWSEPHSHSHLQSGSSYLATTMERKLDTPLNLQSIRITLDLPESQSLMMDRKTKERLGIRSKNLFGKMIASDMFAKAIQGLRLPGTVEYLRVTLTIVVASTPMTQSKLDSLKRASAH